MNDDLCDVEYVDEDRVSRVRRQMPAADTISRASTIFKTLSDSSRLKILVALATEDLCVCDMARLLGVSQSNLSHQLRLMKATRVVSSRREGKMSYYSLADAHVMEIVTAGLHHASEPGTR